MSPGVHLPLGAPGVVSHPSGGGFGAGAWGRAELSQLVSLVTVPKLGTGLGPQLGGGTWGGCPEWQLPAQEVL